MAQLGTVGSKGIQVTVASDHEHEESPALAATTPRRANASDGKRARCEAGGAVEVNPVVAPVVEPAVGADRKAVATGRPDRASRHADRKVHEHRTQSIRRRAIAELAGEVRSPCVDVTPAIQCKAVPIVQALLAAARCGGRGPAAGKHNRSGLQVGPVRKWEGPELHQPYSRRGSGRTIESRWTRRPRRAQQERCQTRLQTALTLRSPHSLAHRPSRRLRF